MTGARISRLPGYRPSGSSRNGLTVISYRFRKTEGWDPYRGVHRDPEAVAPSARTMASQWPGGRAERMAAYAQARREGLTRTQAAGRVGIAAETALKYERAYKRGEAS